MMHTIEHHGFTIAQNVLDQSVRDEIVELLGPCPSAGRRGLLANPEIAKLAKSEQLLAHIRPYLSDEPRPVRGIYFDKSPDANWLVTWHQDLTIEVRERLETDGFGLWSMKEGICHVQPPIEILENMLTLRIHLDDADETNGALRVFPGTHSLGRISAEQIPKLRKTHAEITCNAKSGDALLMRPLLLHASNRSTSTRHRRVLHIEYASCDLPCGLEWNEEA